MRLFANRAGILIEGALRADWGMFRVKLRGKCANSCDAGCFRLSSLRKGRSARGGPYRF